ncbi:MAG TPA: MarR family transcriptional regulator [Sphingomicrobium sp.]|nr:MarR family transcriptional regulator [Sphingomicrobium sp.]
METILPEIGETAHALRKAFTRRATDLGVTGAQWKVLFKLSRTPDIRQVELAEMLDIEPITLTRILDRLQDAGLIERVADPADRRAWRLHLTVKAGPLVKKLRTIADDMTAEAFAGIDPKDIETTRQVLALVRERAGHSAVMNKVANQ